jgi:hypothetical protein
MDLPWRFKLGAAPHAETDWLDKATGFFDHPAGR